jgi:hypothetical protein
LAPEFTPLALVVDRPTAGKLKPAIADLGGDWVTMFDTWQHSGFAYLLLLAHTPVRLKRRAPLTMLADNTTRLREVIQTACSQLDDVDCRWLICVEPGSEADQIVREEVLRDSTAEGHA